MPPPAPNVLLIIADDFGVQQLGCSASGADTNPFFITPNLDRLAAEGVRFSRAYATAPVCTPARASLYTGIHPARLHLTDYIPGSEVINPPMAVPPWQRGLAVSAVTLGDALKARGYATAHFGKWHFAPDYNYVPGRPMDPESQGFDEVCVTRKPVPEADPERDPHHIELLTTRAIEFCNRPRREPFLCVLAHNAVHRPELAPAALTAKYRSHPAADPDVNRPVLAAMVEQLDASIGRLMTALRAGGRERDTLVIFTADHGPVYMRERRRLLRGAKADLYEGGLRVPLVLRWPERIAPGRLIDAIVSGMDVFPTVLDACHAPAGENVDGLNLWPLLRGASSRLPREALHWHYPHYHHLGLGPCSAIRVGDFKLIEWFGSHPNVELFDLVADPGELCSLAASDLERRDELRRQLHVWRCFVGAQEMSANPNYDPSLPTRVGPPLSDLTVMKRSS